MSSPAGVGVSPSSSTIVLRPSSGNLHLKIRHQGSRGSAREVVVKGVYGAGEAVETRGVPRVHRMFPRGAGWSSRPGILEQGHIWDGFADAENACLRFGFICPSGKQTAVSVDPTWGRPQKIVSFNNDLFFVFTQRIAYLESGAGPLVSLYSLAGDFFYDGVVWNGALRVSNTCSHLGPPGPGQQHSFVTITPSGATYTVSHPDGSYGAGPPPQIRQFVTAFWEYQGVGGYRLVGQDTDYTFRYMIVPNGDPYDAANWGPAVQVGDRTHNLRRAVASHDTVWWAKLDGLYAVTDKNAMAGGENLTPYWSDQLDDYEIRIRLQYFNQWIVASHAYGIELIDVNSWQVKDAPRPAQVGYGRPNNTPLAGATTAFCTDSGWLVQAIRGQDGNQFRARVLYGTPRRRESPAGGVTEVDWFPEVGPFEPNRDIVTMTIFTEPLNGRPYLWLGFKDDLDRASLVSVALFTGGNPLADPSHRYHTTSSVTFTDEHWAARSAVKGALRGSLAVRGCGSGRRIDLFAAARAGGAFPGSPQASVTTNVETATFPLTSVRGNVIRSKAVLVSTEDVPVVIDEWEMRANLGFPLSRSGTWLVELSDLTEGDLPSSETPSAVEAALKRLCETVEAFPVTDDEGTQMTVVLANVLPWQKEDAPTNDLTVRQKTRLLEVGWQEVESDA